MFLHVSTSCSPFHCVINNGSFTLWERFPCLFPSYPIDCLFCSSMWAVSDWHRVIAGDRLLVPLEPVMGEVRLCEADQDTHLQMNINVCN